MMITLFLIEDSPVGISPFRLGGTYQTKNGKFVTLIGESNKGNSYHTMYCEKGIHRYVARDFGRVTGTDFDCSDPRCLVMPPIEPIN